MARRVDPERTAARRAAITDAAARLFGERGFDRTTAAEIARAAGVSAGSVFYYFEDKQAVFRAVFEADLPAAHAQAERHAGSSSALAGILATVDELAGEANLPEASGLMVELLRVVDRDPGLQEAVAAVDAVRKAGVAALVHRAAAEGEIAADLAGERAETTAAWVLAVVDGAFLTAVPGHDVRPHVRRVVRGYLTSSPEGEHR